MKKKCSLILSTQSNCWRIRLATDAASSCLHNQTVDEYDWQRMQPYPYTIKLLTNTTGNGCSLILTQPNCWRIRLATDAASSLHNQTADEYDWQRMQPHPYTIKLLTNTTVNGCSLILTQPNCWRIRLATDAGSSLHNQTVDEYDWQQMQPHPLYTIWQLTSRTNTEPSVHLS